MTINLVSTYRKHSPDFKYTFKLRDNKKTLTFPSEAKYNHGKDNGNADCILHVGDVLTSTDEVGNITPHQYIIESLLGHGSFGQVVKCMNADTHKSYAVKVIKNRPEYIKQSALERKILEDVYYFIFFTFNSLNIVSV